MSVGGAGQMSEAGRPQNGLVRSRQRVVDHGEVFTPSWLVDDMLDLVGRESARIDARFLEPACGSGNFLVEVLTRKLTTVKERYGRSDFERQHHALLSLMCVYGIELLADNAMECRQNLLETLLGFLRVDGDSDWGRAARGITKSNVVEGDALAMRTSAGDPITFPEWGYLGKGKYQRRDFQFSTLTQRSSFEGSLFELLEEHDVFIPTRTYAPMTLKEIGA